MARIGSQNRLLIPSELTRLVNLEGKVGVYWDDALKAIYLSKLDLENEYYIGSRIIDNKNRIGIQTHFLELLDANVDSEFVIALKNHRIYIFKSEEDTET